MIFKENPILNRVIEENGSFNILIISNNNDDIASIKKIFDKENSFYNYFICEDNDSIFDTLNTQSINLILMDYIFLDFENNNVLKKIKDFDSDLECILLSSGYSENLLIKIINSNLVYKLFIKPFNDDDLFNAIHKGLEIYFLKKYSEEYKEEIENKNLIFEELYIRMDNILKNISDGVIVIFPDGKINLATDRAKQLIFNDEDINLFGTSLFDTQIDDYLKQKIFFFIRSESFSEKIEWNVHNRIFSIYITRFENNKKKLLGFIIVFIDITKEKEIDKLKSDFVSNVSHELRTPLSSIQGFSEMLLNSSDFSTEKQKDFLKIIYKESVRLSEMVNSILNLSKIESNNQKADLKEIELYNLINEIIVLLQNKSDKKFIDIDFICEDSRAKVKSNKGMVKEILLNIIDNAVKYTQKYGKVDVSMYYDNNNVVLSIKDNGIGISESDKENIFKKFYRVNSNSEEKGTGLGLSIVKALADRIDLEIKLNSKIGQGTEFILIFPEK